jgi:hypothetical protein
MRSLRLLRARRERPIARDTTNKGDEVPPPHSITSSARASRVGGTVSPSAFAVLRLSVLQRHTEKEGIIMK